MAAMLQDSYPAPQHRARMEPGRRQPLHSPHAPRSKPHAMLTEIALVLLLALCNGFFALSEMALVASRKSRLKQMARSSRRAAVALRHAEKPEYFLSTIQVGITLLMLVTGAVAGDALGAHIAALLHGGGAAWLEPYARIIGVVLGFVLISFIQIVVGELVPKRLALSAPEKVSAVVAVPMLLSAQASPLRAATAPRAGIAQISTREPALGVARGEFASLRALAGAVRLESRVEVLQDGRVGDRIRVRTPGAMGTVFATVVAPHQLELAR